jgi:hypothetical protein
MVRQQRGDVRKHPEIARLARAVERAAPARPGFVDAAAADIVQVRTAAIDERQRDAVIKEHATVTRAAGSFAGGAGEFYHDRRADSAAIGALRWLDGDMV